jgi:hypothetical protein
MNKRKQMNESEPKIVVEQNPYNGAWDVGWDYDEVGFTPCFCGYATKEEAEAQIPGFDERVERELQAYMDEQDVLELEQNKRFPNLGYVRQQINKLAERGKNDQAFDALQKLDWLLDLDLAEHISWPLPSWKAIKSGRVYGR